MQTSCTKYVLIVSLACFCMAAVVCYAYLIYKRSSIGKYNELISIVRSDNKYVREFEAIFPNAIHSVSYFTGEYGTPMWNSKVGIGDRYLLTLQMPVSFDRNLSNTSYGEPAFHLIEITRVRRRSDGGLDLEMNGVSTTFGSETWDVLVRHRGDLKSIGVAIQGEATPGFERAWPDI